MFFNFVKFIWVGRLKFCFVILFVFIGLMEVGWLKFCLVNLFIFVRLFGCDWLIFCKGKDIFLVKEFFFLEKIEFIFFELLFLLVVWVIYFIIVILELEFDELEDICFLINELLDVFLDFILLCFFLGWGFFFFERLG